MFLDLLPTLSIIFNVKILLFISLTRIRIRLSGSALVWLPGSGSALRLKAGFGYALKLMRIHNTRGKKSTRSKAGSHLQLNCCKGEAFDIQGGSDKSGILNIFLENLTAGKSSDFIKLKTN
jgi:hypothetical protein